MGQRVGLAQVTLWGDVPGHTAERAQPVMINAAGRRVQPPDCKPVAELYTLARASNPLAGISAT